MDRTIFRAFKAKGLSISADACRALGNVLQREDNVQGSLDVILLEVIERIEKREIKSSVIDVDTITSIVAFLSSSDEDLQQESTQLFDAFSSPKLEYDDRSKTYKINPRPSYTLHGTVESRAMMYRGTLSCTSFLHISYLRPHISYLQSHISYLILHISFLIPHIPSSAAYQAVTLETLTTDDDSPPPPHLTPHQERLQLAQQRLLRSGVFTLRGMGGARSGSTRGRDVWGQGEKNEMYELSTIESLLGSEGKRYLFGMLTQVSVRVCACVYACVCVCLFV
jgi:hypothetical protein